MMHLIDAPSVQSEDFVCSNEWPAWDEQTQGVLRYCLMMNVAMVIDFM